MSYDLLIKNGTVVDGTGSQPVQADIAVADGKIAEHWVQYDIMGMMQQIGAIPS